MSRIRLSKIESLNFEADEYTTGRRLDPVLQLQCTGKGNNCAYQPESVHCENRGYDDYSNKIQWKCTTSLPANLKLGKVKVNCEQWDENGDVDYILKGSCALKYNLVSVDQGSDKSASTFFGVIFFVILAIILYNLFCGARRRGTMSGSSYDPNVPPPPYTPKNDQWRPGFWTGLGVGGAGAHLYDQFQNRDSHHHSDNFDSRPGPATHYESSTSYGGTDTR
ncbi:DUF1183-domain-containing protein [Wallemia mellicola]|nr:DUF1183-domain-containing protein [Wallemia mellicola]